ncbi:MAG: GNAT family N-acetyltransferase [Chloroflexi bacterium]|nr:GNAT family N-acetyltransferase [Chloroflexota bacterium]MCC6892220.1 GNAT family N-acetyltransferase [Anaerolineae bacterium]
MHRQLKDGLILRSLSEGHPTDREGLPEIYADVNCEGDPDVIKNGVRGWARDLLDGHPTVTPDDIFVVVDPAKDNCVVSATLLIPQTWRYEDIAVSVGRPELVATRTEYRGRGLVRELFDAVHERSAALGHQVQAITGIPYFYRQFGYTMAVDLGEHAYYPLTKMKPPKPDYKPAFTLRPATEADIPNMMRWHSENTQSRLLTEVKSPEVWRYEAFGRRRESFTCVEYQIIVNAQGQGVGYLELFLLLEGDDEVRCSGYTVGSESSYLETFEDVVRGVKEWAQTNFKMSPNSLVFGAGLHDSIDTLIWHTEGGYTRNREYMWYIRVPQMIPFLKHIQPVLERRLEGSGAQGFTGELKIGFYDLTGIRFAFERGKITGIEPISGKDGYDASFPWDLFWNVVFGQHQPDDIGKVLPDVWATGKGAVLLEALFPKRKSWLKGLT